MARANPPTLEQNLTDHLKKQHQITVKAHALEEELVLIHMRAHARSDAHPRSHTHHPDSPMLRYVPVPQEPPARQT